MLTTVDVGGQWTGEARTFTVMMNLQQRGAFVAGDVTILGMNQGAARGTGALEGELNGDVLRLRQTNGQGRFEVRVTGDEMTGNGEHVRVELRCESFSGDTAPCAVERGC